MVNNNDERVMEIICGSGVYLVDVWAQWCKPCVAFMPQIEALSKECGVKLIKVDAEREGAIAIDLLNVQSLPTIVLFKNGKEIERWIGTVNINKIREAIGEAYAEVSMEVPVVQPRERSGGVDQRSPCPA